MNTRLWKAKLIFNDMTLFSERKTSYCVNNLMCQMQENEHKLEVFYEELDPLRGCTSS